jgi:hypothetical protein
MANNQNTPFRNVSGSGTRVTGPEQDERMSGGRPGGMAAGGSAGNGAMAGGSAGTGAATGRSAGTRPAGGSTSGITDAVPNETRSEARAPSPAPHGPGLDIPEGRPVRAGDMAGRAIDRGVDYADIPDRTTGRPDPITGAAAPGSLAGDRVQVSTSGPTVTDGVPPPAKGPNPNYPQHAQGLERGADGGVRIDGEDARQGRSVGLYWVLAIGLVLVVIGFVLSYMATDTTPVSSPTVQQPAPAAAPAPAPAPAPRAP